MLKLTLQNFRCFQNAIIEIPLSKGIILLNGNSGIGKTTVFKAIHFVLYNKEQKCITYGKKKCSVVFEFNNIIITRTKNPNHLTLLKDHITYEDISAQSIIYDLFGQHFLITSYIAQKNLEGFFNLSREQKSSFLQTIISNSYQTDNLKLQIKQDIKTTKDSYLQLNSKNQLYETLITKFSITSSPIVPDFLSSFNNIQFINEQLEYINKQTDILSLHNKELQQKYNIQLKSKYEYDSIQQNINYFKTEYNNIIQLYLLDYNITSLIDLENAKQILKNKKILISKYEKYKATVELNSQLKEKYTQELYNINCNINKLQLIQNKETLLLVENILKTTQTKTLKEFHIKHKKIIQDFKKTSSEYDTISQTIKDTELTNKQIEQTIKQLKDNIYLSCPNCNSSLIYINNHLKCDTTDINKDITELQKQIKTIDYTSLQSLEKSKLKLYNTYSEYKKYIQSVFNSKEINTEYILYDYSLEEIKHNIIQYELKIDYEKNKKRVIQQLETLKEEIISKNEIDEYNSISELTLENITIKLQKIEQCLEYKLKLDNYLHKKTLLNIDTTLYDELIHKNEDKIIKYKEEYSKLQIIQTEYLKYENDCKQYEEYINFMKEFNKSKEKEKNIYVISTNLEKFYTKVIQAESEHLEQTIHSINEELDFFMERFFDNKYLMRLTSTKTLTDGEKRYHIDVLLYDNQGNELHIDNLSGGEFDRCSLALFLVFNKLSHGNIILLDECLSSLHSDSVIEIIDTIKEYFMDKLVLITLHQANIGMFDYVYNLSSLYN